eukprot:9426386-Pyramimonas_sp.AAC.1
MGRLQRDLGALELNSRSTVGCKSSLGGRTWDVRAQIETWHGVLEHESRFTMYCLSSNRGLIWGIRAQIEIMGCLSSRGDRT